MIKKIVISIILLTEALLCFAGCNTAISTVATGNDALLMPNPIVNASMEIPSPGDCGMPTGWSKNCWGRNTAAFTYLDNGFSDDHSVKIEVSNYKDGDAKWFFNPVKLVSGDFLFSHYYRSDVDTRVVVAVTTQTGDLEYIDLPNAPASLDWAKYEEAFMMPKNGEAASVYHLLSQDGYLITDDYQIAPYHYEGFERGLVTITFDDGWEKNTQTALPVMQEFGFKSNQFYATTYIENPRVPNARELIQLFIDDGHEIGSHTVTHPYLTALSAQEVTFELADSKAFLESYLGVSISYFATPFGAYNTSVNESIMTYYDAHRTAVESGYNSKDNFDVSRLKSQSCLSTTSATQIEEWVRKAKEEKLWLILLYHCITDDPNEYDTTPEIFREHMQVIKDSGLPVVTFSQAISELECQ